MTRYNGLAFLAVAVQVEADDYFSARSEVREWLKTVKMYDADSTRIEPLLDELLVTEVKE